MKRIFTVFILLAAAALNGCSTLADAKQARGAGSVKYYDQDYSSVWAAAVSVVSNSGLDLVSENKDTGEVLAQRGMSAFSHGENVALFIEEDNGVMRVKVEIISKRALSTNVLAANWETELFKRLDERLGM